MKPILGIDWGRARVGVAVSDETHLLARPVETVRAPSRAAAVARIKEIAAAWGAGEVVVGLPRGMDGSEGESARAARAFAGLVAAAAGLPVALWDERLSTWEGERIRAGRKSIDKDQAAACVILQSYLDGRRTRGERGER